MSMKGTTLGKSKRRSGSGRKTLVKPRLFKTLADVKAANKASDHHFFDRAAMRAFKSRIESGLVGGRFFITSEDFGSGRVFSVRRANTGGSVETIWTAIKTKKEAQGISRKLSKEFDAR